MNSSRSPLRTRRRVVAGLIMTVIVMMAIVACGGSAASGSGADSPGVVSPNTIVIKGFAFMPTEITVSAGEKIKVLNQDSATHTVTATDNSFDSGNVAASQSVEFTAPSTPGNYPFRCTPHPFMTGTLVVR